MNEIIRRIVMMIGIVAIGTILIFFNTSIIITLSATLAFGIIMAMGTGLLKKEDFTRLSNLKIPSIKNIVHKKDREKSESKKTEPKKGINKEKNPGKTGTILSRFHKPDQKTSQTDKPTKSKKTGFSAGLSAAIGSFNSTIHKSRDKKHSEKIDTLLKTTINEPVISPDDSADNQPESASSENMDELPSDDMDLFDEEDFASLDSLEIEGEEIQFDFDGDDPVEPPSSRNNDSDTQNMDDEINSILLAGNAFDEDDDISSEYPNDTDSPEPQSLEEDNQDIDAEEGLFNSEEFFVQGIEDGLDEESFINLPDSPPIENPNPSKITLNDSLDELSNITEFEKMDQRDDEFSGFDAINLDELETDDFSLETDEIIIEEEEINETDILPDDFIPSPDMDDAKNETSLSTGNNILSDNTGLNTPEMDAPISFSTKNEYDDIMDVLQSDAKKTKTISHSSLVRDLKDVNVEAKDLVSELETVLNAMGGKPRQTDTQNKKDE